MVPRSRSLTNTIELDSTLTLSRKASLSPFPPLFLYIQCYVFWGMALCKTVSTKLPSTLFSLSILLCSISACALWACLCLWGFLRAWCLWVLVLLSIVLFHLAGVLRPGLHGIWWTSCHAHTVTQKIIAMFDTCDMYGYNTRNKTGQNRQKYGLESSASWL